jgi:hypothetical protein
MENAAADGRSAIPESLKFGATLALSNKIPKSLALLLNLLEVSFS